MNLSPNFLVSIKLITVLYLMSMLQSCESNNKEESKCYASETTKKINSRVVHGVTLYDEFNWLKAKNYPEKPSIETLEYLKCETKVSNQFFENHKTLLNNVYHEMSKTYKKSNKNLNSWQFGHSIISEYKDKSVQRPSWFLDIGKNKKLLLDENIRAKGNLHFHVGSLVISPNLNSIAWTEDISGSDRFDLFWRSLITNKTSKIDSSTGSKLVWSPDGKKLFYYGMNKDGRLDTIRYITPDDEIHAPKILYTEEDKRYWVEMESSLSDKFLFVNSYTRDHAELSAFFLDNLDKKPLKVTQKKDLKNYQIDHVEDKFIILENSAQSNGNLILLDEKNYQKSPVLSVNEHLEINQFIAFEKNIAVHIKERDKEKLLIINLKNSSIRTVKFPDEYFSIKILSSQNTKSDNLRIQYDSMLYPQTVWDYDMSKNIFKVLKQDTIKGFRKENYVAKRLFAPGPSGIKIPITLIKRKELDNKATPAIVTGYGAYSVSYPIRFPKLTFSAIERGFSHVVVHTRGGAEFGKEWYEQGRLLNKKNSFSDFISAIKYLVNEGFIRGDAVSAHGSSAGGLLVGAAYMTEPQLFHSVSLHAPFVDVLNTLLDPSLPLTAIDWEEFGNPIKDPSAFEYIRSYSPYENIKKFNYPPTYIRGALEDSAVTYWEPAKFAARLRANSTGQSPVFLDIRDGGHYRTDRYGREYDQAKSLTFILATHGVKQ